MPKNLEKMVGLLRQRWQGLKKQWISNVPDDIAICEFDCRKDQCLHDDTASILERLNVEKPQRTQTVRN